MSQQPMNQASSSQKPGLQDQPEKPNELQASLLTLTNTQTQFMTETRSFIKNLEMQVGQLANMLNNRPQGNFPSNTVGSCEKVEPQVEEKVTEGLATKENIQPVVVDSNVKIPYPQRLWKTSLDKQFSKFLEAFKKLHINIPFAEALEKMPSYVKFMKDILSKKQRLEDFETVALTEECSAILQRKLPQKLQDLGSFTIPCTIGKFECKHALCNLGASINLMPLFVFRKLGLGEAKPTTITLQLAYRSIKHPRGVIEDVLVKVDKFIFPADFIVLDMEEDANIPIIFGRPFLATGRALIDVQKGELKLRVQNEEVTFNVFSATTKRKTNVEIGSRAVHHCLKRFYSGKARRLHERWKALMISNIKR
ncbi:uncharacterized protein LOC133815189 [Humulus lupulus]|uniref:uncharacterized protein LOC133815189 n=1 Tax=Humulus lupulus TaxID=3486 RepID=UPI002B409B38|nr:uncharacterized protein LOC133815189 [Humulus lupulus]